MLCALAPLLLAIAPAPLPNHPSVRIERRQASFVASGHARGLEMGDERAVGSVRIDSCVTVDQVLAVEGLGEVAGAVAVFQNLGATIEVSLSPGFEPEFQIFEIEVVFRPVVIAVGPFDGELDFAGPSGGVATRAVDPFAFTEFELTRSERAFWMNEDGFDVFVRVTQNSGHITGSGHFVAMQDMESGVCTAFKPEAIEVEGDTGDGGEGGSGSW